MDQEKLPLLF